MGDSEAVPNPLAGVFAVVEAELAGLELAISRGETLSLTATVDSAIAVTRRLAAAYAGACGDGPPPDADVLDVLRMLVKRDPSWGAIRDNCRELVYYRNCINMGRRDALPQVPEKMAVRTARHVCLYIKTRCIREGRLADLPGGRVLQT